VLPVYGGRVYRLEQHLDRLDRSLREIRIDPVIDHDALRRICGGLVARNGGGDLLIYLQVSRGVEPERMHVPGRNIEPTIFCCASRLPPPRPDLLERGVTCITAEDSRWGRCDIKSTALLANVLLKWRAQDAGAAEAILLRDGQLTEGSTSSVHVVSGGGLVTPPQSPRLLPGTTRGVLEEIARRCNIPWDTAEVSDSQLRNADELILASAGGGLRAVTQLDGQPVGTGHPGPVFRKLCETWLATRGEYSMECTE
jgi:D-alanine transaminase